MDIQYSGFNNVGKPGNTLGLLVDCFCDVFMVQEPA